MTTSNAANTFKRPPATRRDLELTAQIQDHVGAFHSSLRNDELTKPLREALKQADNKLEDMWADQEADTEAVCFSVGKREGWRAAVKLMVLNREAMTAPEMMEKLLAAMIDDTAADQLIYDLTKDEPEPGPLFKVAGNKE